MFAQAYTIAREFTRPVVVSQRTYDGQLASGIGAFVVLNEEGWFTTAWHNIDLYNQLEESRANYADYERAQREILEDATLRPEQRKKKLKALRLNPRWVTQYSFWWGWDGVDIEDVSYIEAADLAVGRLVPFDPEWVGAYPVLKDPTRGMTQGTSLCKLGFPFHAITPDFDPTTGFILPPGSVPPPLFPIEGIYTRDLLVEARPSYRLMYLETSSPGLKGQSGGPTFDQHGTVWAIQSQTQHLELGFEPSVIRQGRTHVEHQFLNVGVGVHSETLVGFLQELGVAHAVSTY